MSSTKRQKLNPETSYVFVRDLYHTELVHDSFVWGDAGTSTEMDWSLLKVLLVKGFMVCDNCAEGSVAAKFANRVYHDPPRSLRDLRSIMHKAAGDTQLLLTNEERWGSMEPYRTLAKRHKNQIAVYQEIEANAERYVTDLFYRGYVERYGLTEAVANCTDLLPDLAYIVVQYYRESAIERLLRVGRDSEKRWKCVDGEHKQSKQSLVWHPFLQTVLESPGWKHVVHTATKPQLCRPSSQNQQQQPHTASVLQEQIRVIGRHWQGGSVCGFTDFYKPNTTVNRQVDLDRRLHVDHNVQVWPATGTVFPASICLNLYPLRPLRLSCLPTVQVTSISAAYTSDVDVHRAWKKHILEHPQLLYAELILWLDEFRFVKVVFDRAVSQTDFHFA